MMMQFLKIFISCNEMEKKINIYTPNRDRPGFFTKVFEVTNSDGFDYVVLCGNFNLVLDPQKDSFNCKNINNPQARSKVLEAMIELDMVNIF